MKGKCVMNRLVITGIVLLAAAGSATAADKPKRNVSDAKATATPAVKAVQQIETAHALAAWGRETKNPQALLVAARMLGEIETRAAAKGEGRLATARGKTASTAGAKPESLTRDSLLAEAEALGGDDPAVLAAIDATRAASAKGVVSHRGNAGPIAIERVVPSYTDWFYDIEAEGGQPLRIAAIGDGAADIDMELIDEHGNVVCKDFDANPTPVCQLTPAWTGKFSARIINQNPAATHVRLISN